MPINIQSQIIPYSNSIEPLHITGIYYQWYLIYFTDDCIQIPGGAIFFVVAFFGIGSLAYYM